ncbi:regulator of microtubule dynamics protein 3 isoform X2 [Girardinichthys multiradiatus]|uniref:regulator of microtubule dynamics protein 3 isoform X2 n=1 Tax=Girardinichthys multiradiatus TaxID=208333 RepID=UPI001FAC8750|nr:regulator of microtubule dynamics protein 3 isoform X2 [Girardinichthys multiradiatus]
MELRFSKSHWMLRVEMEAQQQALAAVEAVSQGLSPEQQLVLRNQLDQVLSCVASLRSEVAELRGGLQDIALQIIQDVKKGVEDSQRVRHRRHVNRARTDSTSSSSIYFTASQDMASTNEETSEGGYSTAYAESEYRDRDTDREEDEPEPEQESEEDEEEGSCATVLTIHQKDSQEERESEEEEVEEKEGRLWMKTEVPHGELALLLAQTDILHAGDATLKAEGFRLLLENRTEYGDNRQFLWRLARSYKDMYESAKDKLEKSSYAQKGREEAEVALKNNNLNVESHKWFAVLTRLALEHESMHSKLKSGHILKEHLDRAFTLRDDDPMCYYLLGRWCYEVAMFDWLEKKAAAALYQSPPTATLNDALENFLKAEELNPGFSRTVRLYIAKCHMELGDISAATNWTKLALKILTTNDEETSELEAQLQLLTDKQTN